MRTINIYNKKTNALVCRLSANSIPTATGLFKDRFGMLDYYAKYVSIKKGEEGKEILITNENSYTARIVPQSDKRI